MKDLTLHLLAGSMLHTAGAAEIVPFTSGGHAISPSGQMTSGSPQVCACA